MDVGLMRGRKVKRKKRRKVSRKLVVEEFSIRPTLAGPTGPSMPVEPT
jgi:hypothetical protein